MPNWCNNSVTVSHPDKEMMLKFSHGLLEGKLFQTFIPMPETEPNWYEWHVENWGTKWDISEGHFELEEDGLSGNGWFSTAWGPPIAAYEKLANLGFSIDAFYTECGMGFVGVWIDSTSVCVDDYYDLFEDKNWRKGIDQPDILDYLEAEYESWLDSDNQGEQE
jgi:hypothetical protein